MAGLILCRWIDNRGSIERLITTVDTDIDQDNRCEGLRIECRVVVSEFEGGNKRICQIQVHNT